MEPIIYNNQISVENYNMLRKSVGWNQISYKRAQAGLNNSSFIIVANVNNVPIGMARVVSDGGYVVIVVDVIVLPEYQGKGIGTEMMKKVMEHIKDSISDGEGVFVNLMAAKGRETFYKQYGFTERPNEKLGAGMTQWISK